METHSVNPKGRLPTEKETYKALGDLDKLPARLKICFDKDDLKDYFTFKKLFSGDDENEYEWIYTHDTPQQTLSEYHKDGPNKVYSDQGKIYIKPQDKTLSELFLQLGTKYAQAFFYGMKTVLLPAGDYNNLDIKIIQHSNYFQIDSSDMMEKTFYKMPDDTYTYMNIVKDDLARKGFGYVIGVSNFKSRTGVFSTARYDPEWYQGPCFDEEGEGDYLSMLDKQEKFNLLLFRSIKVLCHEITHTFGMPHCPYYECLMNGSNTILEGKRKPMYLGPVGLRKVQSVIGFDVIERYEKLIEIIEDMENPYFDKTLKWYQKRYKFLKAKAKKNMCTKVYSVKHEAKPKPKPKVVKTIIKKAKPAKPGPMSIGMFDKAQASIKGMTQIQRLIYEKEQKKKESK